MASTYEELRGAFANATFRNRVEVAVVDAAWEVVNESDATPNHANRLLYAFHALDGSASATESMLKLLLAKNKAQDIGVILGATDSALLSQVQSVWDEFADNYVATQGA